MTGLGAEVGSGEAIFHPPLGKTAATGEFLGENHVDLGLPVGSGRDFRQKTAAATLNARFSDHSKPLPPIP
jgi:hypothetical protein